MIEQVMKASKNKTIQDAAEKFIYKHRPPSIDFFDTDLNLVP